MWNEPAGGVISAGRFVSLESGTESTNEGTRTVRALSRLLLRMDIVSPERRSAMMSGIRGQNTKPEITVRRLAHRLGYRFRLHRRDLPGTPDLVFPGRKKVVLVHGCFWHRHPDCRFAYNPKSRAEFWQAKFNTNVARDLRVRRELEARGWAVLTVWECETTDTERLSQTLKDFLENGLP